MTPIEPTPTDGDALLAQILARPEDDALRLVYADWLQEHGDDEPRAEFIRVQIELARRGLIEAVPFRGRPTHRCVVCGAMWRLYPPEPKMPPPLRDGSWSLCSEACGPCCDNAPMGDQTEPLSAGDLALMTRSDELVGRHGDEWVPGVNALWDWHRGFVRGVTGITATDCLDHLDAVRRAHPVETVRLTTWPALDVDDDALWLIGDPAGKRVAWRDVIAEATEGERKTSDYHHPFLRCRWPGTRALLPAGGLLSQPPGATVQCVRRARAEFDPAPLQHAFGRVNAAPFGAFPAFTLRLMNYETFPTDAGVEVRLWLQTVPADELAHAGAAADFNTLLDSTAAVAVDGTGEAP